MKRTEPQGPLDASGTDGDAAYLSQLGYRQELRRVLGLFSSFAVQFSLIAVSGSIFLLYGYGLTTGGPAFIWPFIVGGILQIVVGLSVAELVSAFPLAGGAFQIIRKTGRPRLAWQAGWWLVIAHIGAVAFNGVALAPYFASAIGITKLSTGGTLLFALGLIALVTIINVVGVRVSALFNNVGVTCELLGMSTIVILLLIAGVVRGPSFLDTSGGVAAHGYFLPFIFVLLMPAFIISSFDSTGNMSEEVTDAARKAPKGVVIANTSAYLYAVIAMVIVTLSITNLGGAMKSSLPLMYVLHERLGTVIPNAFEIVAIVSLTVTTQILELTAARIIWSQARERQLPGASWLYKLSAGRVPVNATLVVGVIAFLLCLWAPVLNALAALSALAWAAAYGVTIGAGMIAKLRRQVPRHPWHYGQWGWVVDGASLVWSAILMVVLVYQSPHQVGLGFVYAALIGIGIYFLFLPRRDREAYQTRTIMMSGDPERVAVENDLGDGE